MLSQFLRLFGFFALVLVAVYWINSAVRLFDRLIGDGQTAGVVLRFMILSLPGVVGIVLPIAAFAAAVYVTNRLNGESELVVLQSSGLSAWRMARPAAVFGVSVALAAAVIAHLLLPMARAQMADMERALARNVGARLLNEGTFLHPVKGVTFFIRRIDPDGTLNDVFLSDRRDRDRAETFTAARALLVNTAPEDEAARPRLVMIDGLAQSLEAESGRLLTTRFDDFSYDLTRLIGSGLSGRRSAQELPTPLLLADPGAVAAETGETDGFVLAEAHGRIRDSLVCLVTTLVGFGALLLGGYSRFGTWRQIGFAVLLLVALKMSENVTTAAILGNAALWPLAYTPVILGLGTAAALLGWAGRARRQDADEVLAA